MTTDTRAVRTSLGSLAVDVTGHGPVAVLWHSLFVDERSWGRVTAALGEHRTLVLVTGPGHGSSPDPGRRYTVDDCARAAADVLRALGVGEPVDWLGNAWGGHVGMAFAAGDAGRCRTLATIGSPVQALSILERARTLALLAAHRLSGGSAYIQDGVAKVLLSPTTRADDPEAVALVKECLALADRAALRNAVVSISLRRKDASPLLPLIPAPTLFITGADHKGWTPAQAESASHSLPRGSFGVVPGAAYLAPLERPDEVSRLVQDFWSSHPADGARA